MPITSLKNPRIRTVLALRASSHRRQRSQSVLVEGLDELRLALAAGHRPSLVISAPDLVREDLAVPEGDRVLVTETVFRHLSVREKPDGWIAVLPRPHADLAGLTLSSEPLILVLESVEKPGNLGAMLRTADAAQVDAVIVCDRRADIFGPNVVRASRGTVFSVPLAETTSEDAIAFMKERRIRTVAADPNDGIAFQAADLSGGIAILMGAEDAGLSAAWMERAELHVRIPMHGRVNSLNVSVAAALLLYEALRQRRT